LQLSDISMLLILLSRDVTEACTKDGGGRSASDHNRARGGGGSASDHIKAGGGGSLGWNALGSSIAGGYGPSSTPGEIGARGGDVSNGSVASSMSSNRRTRARRVEKTRARLLPCE
jgi:hypothetical protein